MMAIDGTWRRPCTMEDVSETGARLTVEGSIEGLALKEFFLLLSTMGKAYRRCQLASVNGVRWASTSSNRVTRRKNRAICHEGGLAIEQGSSWSVIGDGPHQGAYDGRF